MHNPWRSAAYRIAFRYAAAFAVAILVLGAAVFVVADADFRRQRDGVLSEEMEDLAREGLDQRLIREIDERGRLHTRRDFAYALFDRMGRRIGGGLDIDQPPLGYSLVHFHDLAGEWEEGRAKAIALRDGSRLVVALDSEGIEAIDRTILMVFLAAFAGVLVIGFGGALMLGQYLRTRLGAISQTARAIATGEGKQRIAVGRHGDEFDEVALVLNAMLDRIDGLMENLRQVSSDVSHDLRKPLLRLRNQLDLIGAVEGASERAIELLDEILALFSAILRIAEVEGGGLENCFVPLDLSAYVDNIADGYAPAFADSGHDFTWTVEPGIAVLGDRGILAQVVANLLDNAAIHTPPATTVRLELADDHNTALLTVTDNGGGVSAADRSQLLRRFFRAEASRTTPGNGLGLSLVAAAATAHGGSVTVEDAGPGLRVAVNLPRLIS